MCIYIYTLLGGFNPLENMSSSVGMMNFPTEWKNVPNHQPVYLGKFIILYWAFSKTSSFFIWIPRDTTMALVSAQLQGTNTFEHQPATVQEHSQKKTVGILPTENSELEIVDSELESANNSHPLTYPTKTFAQPNTTVFVAKSAFSLTKNHPTCRCSSNFTWIYSTMVIQSP
jgi:hypothetical protein